MTRHSTSTAKATAQCSCSVRQGLAKRLNAAVVVSVRFPFTSPLAASGLPLSKGFPPRYILPRMLLRRLKLHIGCSWFTSGRGWTLICEEKLPRAGCEKAALATTREELGRMCVLNVGNQPLFPNKNSGFPFN